MATLLENGLPVTHVMDVVKGPLVIDMGRGLSSNGRTRPRGRG
jgi:hypothetical protein